jgi:hypothetical protein
VFFASGAALLLGLLLLYVPVSRHPAGLLVWALALLSAGVIAPEPTLLFAQAACLGLVLALVAALLDRRVARRRLPAKIPESSHSRLEFASTRLPSRSGVISNPSSTQAMPAVASPETRNAEP